MKSLITKSSMEIRRRSFAAAALFLLAGCRSSGLDVKIIRSTSGRPSNVAVYFRVDQTDGTPIGGLAADDFRIYEDDGLVSEFESKQTILNPQVAASLYTLLLVDMSGSISKSGEAPAVVEAAGSFADKVEKYQKVGVYAFDGSPELYPIVPFTNSEGAAEAGIQSLARFQPKDPSTNLNGAVIKALDRLKTTLAKSDQPLKFGTLVVFTDGTDRAGRVPKDEMLKAVKDSEYDVFAVGLGAEISQSDLDQIGKNGTALAKDKDAVVQAFDGIARKIEGYTKRYYLLSYCTPARAGEHEVRLEANVKNAEGKVEKSGSARYKFKADGFTPDCNPNTPPSFDVTKGDALAPKEPETAKTPPPAHDVAPPKGASAQKHEPPARHPNNPPPPPPKHVHPPAEKPAPPPDTAPPVSKEPSSSESSTSVSGSGKIDFNP